MRINIEEVIKFFKFRAKINKANLHDVKWFMNNNEIIFKKEDIKMWRFTGLDNLSFIQDYIEEMGGDGKGND